MGQDKQTVCVCVCVACAVYPSPTVGIITAGVVYKALLF